MVWAESTTTRGLAFEEDGESPPLMLGQPEVKLFEGFKHLFILPASNRNSCVPGDLGWGACYARFRPMSMLSSCWRHMGSTPPSRFENILGTQHGHGFHLVPTALQTDALSQQMVRPKPNVFNQHKVSDGDLPSFRTLCWTRDHFQIHLKDCFSLPRVRNESHGTQG